MAHKRLVGRRYDTREAIAILLDDDGRISGWERDPRTGPDPLPWVAPGLIDLQVNGFGGRAFNDASLTVDDVRIVSLGLDQFGVTGYCPTATTDSFDALSRTMSVIARACEQDPDVACRVRGIHLEGPYISPEDGPRGAHPRREVRPPNADEFLRLQDAAAGRIRILTLSPEYPDAPAFISRIVGTGVRVAIGHTNATSDQIHAAADAGASLSTHLGNGSHAQIRRHPNYIWDQLADDRLTASLIVDGHHLPAAVVKCLVRAKTAARCILVSDVVSLAGLPPGRYDLPSLGTVDLLADGRTSLAAQPQLLAGAALPITVGIANMLRFSDEPLSSAIEMASLRPSAIVDRPRPWLQIGQPADLVLFHLSEDLSSAGGASAAGSLSIVATINAGRLVFGKVPATSSADGLPSRPESEVG